MSKRSGSAKKAYYSARERVYDIYEVPEKDRGTRVNIHHIWPRSRGGTDEKSNLYPLPRHQHALLEARIFEIESHEEHPLPRIRHHR